MLQRVVRCLLFCFAGKKNKLLVFIFYKQNKFHSQNCAWKKFKPRDLVVVILWFFCMESAYSYVNISCRQRRLRSDCADKIRVYARCKCQRPDSQCGSALSLMRHDLYGYLLGITRKNIFKEWMTYQSNLNFLLN